LHSGVEIVQSLLAPVLLNPFLQFDISGGQTPRAAASRRASFAVCASGAAHTNEVCGAKHASIRAQSDDFGDVVCGAHAAACDQSDLVADALLLQELVHLRDGELDRHRDVLLGYLRCSPGAAVAAVQMDDMGTGVVRADGDHVDIMRSAHLDRKNGFRIDGFNPVQML